MNLRRKASETLENVTEASKKTVEATEWATVALVAVAAVAVLALAISTIALREIRYEH